MRYTTIIDISEIPQVYTNANVRLVYLHLVLKAGYHEDALDRCLLSIRGVMYQTGLSLSAVRHALHVLEAAGLISRQKGVMHVRKFLYTKPIKKRAKQHEIDPGSSRVESSSSQANEVGQEMSELEKWRKRRDSFIKYYKTLEEKAAKGDESARQAVVRNRKLYEQYSQDNS